MTTSQIADPDLVATIGGALKRTGIRPDLMCLGVPAAALAVDGGEARESITVLTSMGVRITLCQTGVVPVELTLLDDWPITSLEMAPALVRRLAQLDDPECRLARTTAALVGTLRDTPLPVVVPGLCAEREVVWWRSIGAISGSGPYFGEPVAADELAPRSRRW
jgi:predicted signal transduction protein with EAL and GGDEF domain